MKKNYLKVGLLSILAVGAGLILSQEINNANAQVTGTATLTISGGQSTCYVGRDWSGTFIASLNTGYVTGNYIRTTGASAGSNDWYCDDLGHSGGRSLQVLFLGANMTSSTTNYAGITAGRVRLSAFPHYTTGANYTLNGTITATSAQQNKVGVPLNSPVVVMSKSGTTTTEVGRLNVTGVQLSVEIPGGAPAAQYTGTIQISTVSANPAINIANQ